MPPERNSMTLFYPSIFTRSASGVLIGVRPNFSTNTLRTVEEKKAGIEGPI